MSAQSLCDMFKQQSSDEEIIQFLKNNYKKSYMDVTLSYFQYLSLYSIQNNMGDVELASRILNVLQKAFLDPFKGTITLTFGEVAESHVGMQQIGSMDEHCFSYNDLLHAQKYFSEKG